MKNLSKRKDSGRHLRRFFVVIVSVALIITTFSASARVFDGRSGMSLFAEGVLWTVLGNKRDFSEEKTIKKIENARAENDSYLAPEIYKTLYNFESYNFSGREICRFGSGEKLVIYMHGGAFIYQPLLFHYRYCHILARELDAKVLMPIYPKAPTHKIEDMLAFIKDFYIDALNSYSPDNIIFMGDSAGGTLALSLAQMLYYEGKPQPSDVIVISPCVDIALDNPEMEKIQPYDPMLCLPDLQLKMKYCTYEDTDLNDYRISPLYGEIKRIAPITYFTGTYEILVPDARLFNKKATEQGADIDYYEYEKMCHTFCLFPMPEAKECLVIIKDAVYD